MARFEISVTAGFEAAHAIDAEGAPDGYRRLHGHSFLVTASTCAETPQAAGWVMDLGHFEQTLKHIVGRLDHQLLNDIPGLEKPTLENLLLWVDQKLRETGITPSRIEIERPTVRQKAVYTP
jgi:6-pyruvoyltetrahydropterin/6-carboxytetrahydropterin synthase